MLVSRLAKIVVYKLIFFGEDNDDDDSLSYLTFQWFFPSIYDDVMLNLSVFSKKLMFRARVGKIMIITSL